MTGPQRRLTIDDWVAAGLVALAESGPDGVAIEAVAKRLGTTKGSGYWHLGSRPALLRAVLDRWYEVATEQVIAGIEASGLPARARLDRLLALVIAGAERHPGELLTLAHHDPDVRAAVARATGARVGYVAELLGQVGVTKAEARRRAVLAYAAYVGYAQLAATVPDALPAAPRQRQALQRTLVRLLVE